MHIEMGGHKQLFFLALSLLLLLSIGRRFFLSHTYIDICT